MSVFDIAIVGAGIVGSAVARECTRAGLRVAVIEGGVPAGAASAAGMGHVVVMDDSPAQLALSHYSRSLWLAMRDALPTTAEYEATGTLWVAADDEEMAEVHAKARTYATVGVRTEILDAQQLAEAEPALRPGLAGALRVIDDAVVYPPTAARFFLDEALAGGAQIVRARAVRATQGQVELANGQTIAAGRIVLAVGAESDLLPALPIQRRKGHLVITDRYPGLVHHQLVELGYLKSAHKTVADSVAFNVQPRRTGQLLIGSSRQYGSTNPHADMKILREMLDRAVSYMPSLANLSVVRIWTGFRAASKDKLPLLGPATNAPGAARLVTDMLLDRPSAIDPTPFLATRLAQPEAVHA
jgi:D-hydroxyproline dehydrogenase subunit beta